MSNNKTSGDPFQVTGSYGITITGKSSHSSRFLCSICNEIMMEPTQAICGCRFCSHCIKVLLTEHDILCPNCKDQTIQKHELIRDRAVEKEIMHLEIKCTNNDCKETLLLKQLANHLSICDFRKEQCNLCQHWYVQKRKEQHMSDECGNRLVVCDDCGLEMKSEDMKKKHKNYSDNIGNICEKWVSECPYKCENGLYVHLKTHLDICVNKPVFCPLKDIGCNVIETRGTINKHFDEDITNHQKLMMNEIQRLRKDNEKTKELYRNKQNKIRMENDQLRLLNSENEDKIQMLATKIEQMNRDIESLILESETYKKQLKPNLRYLTKDIVCYNNSATWTISDIRTKINNAKSRITDTINSDPFYITHPGYNMTLKIYPNGDGSAKNTHLSAYFVINKGEFDDKISWPFKSKVTLSLLSSKPIKEDIKVHMQPDNNPACYGRPLSNSNVGAGQPQFVQLTEILNNDYYLHNDSRALKMRISIQSSG